MDIFHEHDVAILRLSMDALRSTDFVRIRFAAGDFTIETERFRSDLPRARDGHR